MLAHLGHSCPACGAEAICRPYPLYGVRGGCGCETEWSRLVKGLYQLTLDQLLDQLVAPQLAIHQLGQAFECDIRRRRSVHDWQ